MRKFFVTSAVLLVLIASGCSKNSPSSAYQNSQIYCSALAGSNTGTNTTNYWVGMENDVSGDIVTDATVKFNGILCPWNNADADYELSVTGTIPAGTTVTMTVASSTLKFSAAGVMPAAGDSYFPITACDSNSKLDLGNNP